MYKSNPIFGSFCTQKPETQGENPNFFYIHTYPTQAQETVGTQTQD